MVHLRTAFYALFQKTDFLDAEISLDSLTKISCIRLDENYDRPWKVMIMIMVVMPISDAHAFITSD
jgi:hypothetical protein